MKKNLIILAMLLMSAITGHAEGVDTPVIEVTGSATMNIIPDRITIEIGMEEYYKHKASGDSTLVKLSDIEMDVRKTLGAAGVPDSLIVVSDLGNYRNRDMSSTFLMAKRLSATVSDFNQIERISDHLDRKGIVCFNITKIDNSDMGQYNRQGLKAALDAARQKAEFIAENEELNLLVNALGVEDDMEQLRYNNIIVATDADDDGMHIRMLVLTFFMKYYPDLIRRGHVHILQTPLFRVKNKKDIRYCFSIDEKEKAVKELKSGVEITRFKGLGEISSTEFVDFIGENMRLDKVKLSDEESIAEIMEFYMGDNTIDRQNFIRQHLRSETELEDVNI